MSYSVTGTTIMLTRGDSFIADILIAGQDGQPYIPVEGDIIRFAMKISYKDAQPLLIRNIPIDTMKLAINPEDTKELAFGKYVYDIELTKSTGEVDTFITKAVIKITEEVY